MSDSSWPQESQHARPPSLSKGDREASLSILLHPNSRPLSPWCYPASHLRSSPSPPAPNPSQHQSLFQWVNSSHEVAKVLEFQLWHQSFQWTPRNDLLLKRLIGSFCSPRDSQESLSTPEFKSISSLAFSFLPVQLSHPYMTTGILKVCFQTIKQN